MCVVVQDLIEFLHTFDPMTPVELDKDGWLEDEIEYDNPVQLIKRRGVFTKIDESKFGGGIVLFINN